MGDRNNPIKFGPEWLRNLSRERTAGGSANNSSNTASASATTTSGAAAGSSVGITSSPTTANNTNTNTASPKVQLAKLRYGREEMLALFDRTSEAPQELKYIDVLYQPRGKPPFALNNTFEEDMRDSMRTGPPLGAMASGERFGLVRGLGRTPPPEARGRARLPFIRQLSAGRGATSWHAGSPRTPGYSGGVDEDASPARSWNNGNGGSSATRSSGDQAEWTPNKNYRSKRPGTNTNWRTTRDEEEWRASDTNRTPRTPQEKWDRDWGDNRQANRRTWVAGDTQNDDNLPEWAVDNAEACSGTFDSSGAFHGYSNDDSNLPKTQESPYALTRSHTQGSFARTKTAEEGSEEWWASEKAKKLSPKRFDASEIKFKKTNSVLPELGSSTSQSTKSNAKQDEANKPPEKSEQPTNLPNKETSESNASSNTDENTNKKSVRFSDSKTFDALMRSDINLEEASDERGNFQSVMINSNNSLRQKHQNIVQSPSNNNSKQNRRAGNIYELLKNRSSQSVSEAQKLSSPEEKISEDFMDLTLEDKEIMSKLGTSNEKMLPKSSQSTISSAMSTAVNSMAQITTPAMQLRMSSPMHLAQGMHMSPKSNITASAIQNAGLQTPMQAVGVTNSALNASLGLPLGPPGGSMSQTLGLPVQGVPPPVLPNQGMGTPGVGPAGLQSGQGLASFQTSAGIPGMPGVNSSLFLGQNTNLPLQSSSDMQLSHGNPNIYPMHGLQHSGSQAAFNSSIYSNIMQQSQASASGNSQGLADQWYYEDPKKNIQGPFSSKEMYSWYRAGFFSPSLMVRRACDAVMRPLGSYGPVVPFAQMDILSSFPMAGFEARNQGTHDSLLNSQQSLGLDVMNMSETTSMDTMQFGSVGIIRNPPFGQQQMVDSLWSQPTPSPDLVWMQQAMNARNDTRVNNLPMFFWDQQPSALASNSLLPEGIAKEMKTEDEILAQLRASQAVSGLPKMPFGNDQLPHPQGPPPMSEDTFSSHQGMAPKLEDLQKLIQEDSLKDIPLPPEPYKGDKDNDRTQVNMAKTEKVVVDTMKLQPGKNVHDGSFLSLTSADIKSPRQPKGEAEKPVKSKDVNNTKTKNNKKAKEEKKEDNELKSKDEEVIKAEKRSEEPSPSKSKKEEKINKKEMEKEKNQWIKEGFTIVKTEKPTKEGKKKAEEMKAAEEAERKRKEEERLAAEEEKKRRQVEMIKRQQEMQQQQQQQRQAAESVAKKAPWSAVATQALQATNKDGLTLAEIQRLEREKKLEQMKEQQQMMHIIAQQQVAAYAREQEMQAGLGWAKKKSNLAATIGQSLAEIQAEARKQAAAAAATVAAAQAQAQALEEAQCVPPSAATHTPWGGGFWDTPETTVLKTPESPKTVETNKNKKKPVVNTPAKKEVTPAKKEFTTPKKEVAPAAEFETWCTSVLTSWSTKIDVPTFVGFLKDIESPYEVKDYVKCYLGDTKDSNDFARQFLERRSKLLRVGMVTPSDDLCSPALAVNPRTASSSDYQEVKSKGKKTKKNKMMKVDAARLLGFSVTAAEDRINVGDIDTV